MEAARRELDGRIRARIVMLLVAAASHLAFVVLFGLPIWAALLSLGSIAAAAFLHRTYDLNHAARIAARADRLARFNASHWQSLIDALPDAAILLSVSGQVQYSNHLAREMFDKANLQVHVSALVRNPKFLEAIAVIGDDEQPKTIEYSDRVPVTQHIAATIAPLGGDAGTGERPARLVIFRDTTEQQRIDQLRSDFITNASHELRTPLASLIGFIDTLQGPAREDPAARERFLGIMSNQAGRMKRLIDDLGQLSRVERLAHLRPRDRVDIGEVVLFVVQSLEPLAQGAQCTIELAGELAGELAAELAAELAVEAGQLAGGRPAARTAVPDVNRAAGDGARSLRVLGDREQLVQVFQNLIHNAIKYGGEQGRIVISLSREAGSARSGGELAGRGGRILVSVRDFGTGIEPQHLPRLTERFYRVDAASSREKGGTGLGLAIVKHIVNRHRGELRIRSTAGEGSTFTVIFEEFTGAQS